MAGKVLNRPADTLYIGGGTPSVIGGQRLARLVESVKSNFGLHNAEITVECNPADDLKQDFGLMAKAGVNRVSLGVQSAVEGELKALSRRHTNANVKRTVGDLKSVGITDFSIDLMLGIPNQTVDSLKQSIDFSLELDPKHLSVYMLKIEPNTPFGKAELSMLNLPNDDKTAEMYLFTSDYLRQNGFEHYEISNFAKKGFEAKHNLKYWLSGEYLGLGPAAYSYVNGKRFGFSRDLEKYLTSPEVISDGDGGDFFEYCMLRLRLSRGIDLILLEQRFGKDKADGLLKKAELLQNSGLIEIQNGSLRLTVNGFLVSNAVIGKLLF